jgi:hypothetical protein
MSYSQEVSPIVIADDDQTAFWTGVNGAGTVTLTDDVDIKYSGTNSLKIDFVNPQLGTTGIYHLYPSNQDWSSKNKIRFWMYGGNTGKKYQLGISNDTTASSTIGVGWHTVITDDFTGPKIIEIAFRSFAVNSGAPVLTAIRRVVFKAVLTVGSSTIYLDRMLVDVSCDGGEKYYYYKKPFTPITAGRGA